MTASEELRKELGIIYFTRSENGMITTHDEYSPAGQWVMRRNVEALIAALLAEREKNRKLVEAARALLDHWDRDDMGEDGAYYIDNLRAALLDKE